MSPDDEEEEEDREPAYTTPFTVSWRTPRAEDVTIKVWGITACLAEPANAKPGASGACIVKGTRIPKSAMTLIATAPASAGQVSWTWRSYGDCDIYDYIENADAPVGKDAVFGIVVGAYSASGQSVFAIAYPGGWMVPNGRDQVC